MFMSGGSRGIGLAIALRAARDGARIALMAKTAEPHPKLPGTVYSAVDEIVAAGGRGVACVADVRDETQVAAAVERGVQEFGGIDILVNNDSAIFLAGTLIRTKLEERLLSGAFGQEFEEWRSRVPGLIPFVKI